MLMCGRMPTVTVASAVPPEPVQLRLNTVGSISASDAAAPRSRGFPDPSSRGSATRSVRRGPGQLGRVTLLEAGRIRGKCDGRRLRGIAARATAAAARSTKSVNTFQRWEGPPAVHHTCPIPAIF
jgi:hypothetical protein